MEKEVDGKGLDSLTVIQSHDLAFLEISAVCYWTDDPQRQAVLQKLPR